MKKATVAAMLFLAIGWSVSSTNAFVPDETLASGTKSFQKNLGIGKVSDVDMVTHEAMTKRAILQVASEVLKEKSKDTETSQRISSLTSLDEENLMTAYYGSESKAKRIKAFKGAVKAILKAAAKVDFDDSEKKLAAAHFDAEQFKSGQKRLTDLRKLVVHQIDGRDYDSARKDSGRMFHTLQDFYSHSNWIENGNNAPNSVLGQPGQSIDNVASPTETTCTDCQQKFYGSRDIYVCQGNIKQSITNNHILTSGYTENTKDTDGNIIPKPKGKCSHGGLRKLESTQDLPAKGGINKDTPYQMISPHYTFHSEAARVAELATIDMLRNFRKDVDDVQKFGEYLGVFESGTSAERIAGSLMRSHNRNAMLQHHWNRINELNTKSNIEDMEAFVAEVRELMAKIERLNERQFRAEQQAQAAAERAAKKRESLKNEDTFKFSDVAAAIW